MLQTLFPDAKIVSTAAPPSASPISAGEEGESGLHIGEPTEGTAPMGLGGGWGSPRLMMGPSESKSCSASLSSSGWRRLGFQAGQSEDLPALGGPGEEGLVQGWSWSLQEANIILEGFFSNFLS